jgi:hypothetical protein
MCLNFTTSIQLNHLKQQPFFFFASSSSAAIPPNVFSTLLKRALLRAAFGDSAIVVYTYIS